MRRRDQRRAAVFAVYQHDVTGSPVEDLLDEDATPWTLALAQATQVRTEALDQIIDQHANGWAVERIAPLERAILRVAILEITDPTAVVHGTPIPPEGAINEAVETAKGFCGSEAPGFVNGILGAVIDEERAK
ncbi:MAG: transcription antitermination protein NusB [Actinomycetes bacterium]